MCVDRVRAGWSRKGDIRMKSRQDLRFPGWRIRSWAILTVVLYGVTVAALLVPIAMAAFAFRYEAEAFRVACE